MLIWREAIGIYSRIEWCQTSGMYTNSSSSQPPPASSVTLCRCLFLVPPSDSSAGQHLIINHHILRLFIHVSKHMGWFGDHVYWPVGHFVLVMVRKGVFASSTFTQTSQPLITHHPSPPSSPPPPQGEINRVALCFFACHTCPTQIGTIFDWWKSRNRWNAAGRYFDA